MITYVPFLKAKSNEIIAVSELAPSVRRAICPFLDYPRKPGINGTRFETAVERTVNSLQRHFNANEEFYFDNYDVDDSVRVGARHNYQILLEKLGELHVIPVVGLDRSPMHIAAVTDLRAAGKIHSDIIAFRITPDYFEEYALVEADIAGDLAPLFDEFDAIDIVFDCGLCTKRDAVSTAAQIQKFSREFCSAYNVRRVIVTGSSIPASIGEILATSTERVIRRRELDIFRATKAIHDHTPVTFGDYTTVSPLYSDVNLPGEYLYNVMTAKLAYTLDDSHFFIRGAGLKKNGSGQYVTMARKLCSRPFFRGAGYSSGDRYFDRKSRGLGANCAPNTVIKPAVNAHISYMVLGGIV